MIKIAVLGCAARVTKLKSPTLLVAYAGPNLETTGTLLIDVHLNRSKLPRTYSHAYAHPLPHHTGKAITSHIENTCTTSCLRIGIRNNRFALHTLYA
eukprot:CFRG6309T1